MKLRLDPWATEYDTAFYVEDLPEVNRASIDAQVETTDWQGISPMARAFPFDELLFIDGSRRTEARVLLEDDLKQVAFGAVGTFGVGVVSCCPNQSRLSYFVELEPLGFTSIRRLCTLSSGYSLPGFEVVSRFKKHLGQLSYSVESTAKKEADAVVRQLQFKMLQTEQQLASRLCESYPKALIVADGPRPKMGYAPNVVGYVKTMHVLPLAEEQIATVRELEEGQRSPLYLISNNDKSQQLFEFFLRLRDPRPWLYSFAGMVRLQLAAGSRPEERLPEAIQLADSLTTLLPRFATKQHQDPRAPQQLLPIRALEAELKRKMGHPQMVRRRLTEYFSQTSEGA
ncbi:MAG: hypothetical protein KC422_13250 [Trueperaceae bacterium]|nr:hypothetical protein [Trueperaceae bacterium]